MLKYENGSWRLCVYLIKYTQHGEEQQSYDTNTVWWENFVQMWDHTVIDEVENVSYTDEQIARFQQIKDMPEDFGHIYTEYVLTGNLVNIEHLQPTHPFNAIVLANKVNVMENGIIIESIETSNGMYSKFSNGVLVCQADVALEDIQRIVFIHGFKSTPAVSITSAENTPVDYVADSKGLTLNNAYNHAIHYAAIGRWK